MRLENDFSKTKNIEFDLLLEGIYQQYGYDFRKYARSSLMRRIEICLEKENLKTISGLLEKILHDPKSMSIVLDHMTINVSGFFRDPKFFAFFRQRIVPILKTYPFIRIWFAGCSSGEEVYSFAILLHEEDIYKRCKLYATDINMLGLKRAERAIYQIGDIKKYTQNYIKAGGKKYFSDYYSAKYENVIFKDFLKKNMIFSHHNLVTDSSFNEFNLIICRNVMIYFNKDLKEQIHGLLYNSLCNFGILGLGDKESLEFSFYKDKYEQLDNREKIYRKK
ncbi:chemotaxis protein methyltransferase CheR [Candidatus Magnetomorum sp. HK-1]|nr:chemotaxis protein methyltransferase CheR [Candidatus Magnetomorum sp. HK-1]